MKIENWKLKIHFFFSRRNGFTLIELIVILFIISMITTMTVAGIKEGNRNLALDAATSELIADIEQMKNNALSGLHEDVNTAQLSWGVELRPNQGSYKICSDKSKTTENDFICGTGDTLTTKTLPYGIVIQTYDPRNLVLYLNFASSTGKFHVNSQHAQNTVIITLRDSVTENT